MFESLATFSITRTYAATAAELWSVWTDADALSAFCHPIGSTTPRSLVEVNARIGGRYHYTLVNEASGDSITVTGVYLDLDPYRQVQFSWSYPEPRPAPGAGAPLFAPAERSADPADVPIVTVALKELAPVRSLGPRTTLTLTAVGLEGAPGDRWHYDTWASTLDSLAQFLATRSGSDSEVEAEPTSGEPVEAS